MYINAMAQVAKATQLLPLILLFFSIDIFAVTNFDYVHNEYRILDCVEDAIAALSDSITLAAGKFQCTRRSWIMGE